MEVQPLLNQPQSGPTYILGHKEDELARLIDQSRFFGELTEQFFLKAGIRSGMRVLDLGCGAGDVAMLAAKLVGPSGSVVGVDRAPESVALAGRRAAAAQLDNVTFIQSDLASFSLDHPVDAVVGRLVLIYLGDATRALRQIATYVKPGGLIALQEMDASGIKSVPSLPLFEQTNHWILETFRRAKIDLYLGLKLFQIFRSAGLPNPQMTMATRVEGGPDSAAYEYLTRTVRTLLPMMEKFGVAKSEQVDIETLALRLRDEVTAGGGVIVLPSLVGTWARKTL